MKKQGILNSHIAEVLANMGHTDTIVIADCGLPIPEDVKRIDLALKIGSPAFKETLEAIIEDMAIEEVTIAEEIFEKNPGTAALIENRFEKIEAVPHEEFKVKTAKAKAVIRTGEATPYANIILHSGVIF